MDSSSPSQAKVFREVEQLGLSLSEPKPKEHAIKVEDNFKDLYNPDVDKLLEYIHIGPQGPLLEKLGHINQRYRMDLKFTKTFRWSPGYKAQLAHRLKKWAGWDKNPTCAVHRIFDKINDHGYWRNNLKDDIVRMDNDLREKRAEGMVWLEDPQLILDALQTVRDKINAELQILTKFKTLPIQLYIDISRYEEDAHEYYGDYVHQIDWEHYKEYTQCDDEYGDFYNFFDKHYISITLYMKDFNINVTDSDEREVAKIPFEGLSLQFQVNLNRLLNKMQGTPLHEIVPTGTYGYHYNNRRVKQLVDRRAMIESKYGFTHPYVSSRGERNSGEWRGVCLGDLDSEMTTSAARLDIASLVLHFQKWATSYSVGHTNPLNRIQYSHFGMPKGYDKFYVSSVGQDVTHCFNRISRTVDPEGLLATEEVNSAIKQVCEGIKCQLRDNCRYYAELKSQELEQSELTDEQKVIIKQMQAWAQTARGGGLNG